MPTGPVNAERRPSPHTERAPRSIVARLAAWALRSDRLLFALVATAATAFVAWTFLAYARHHAGGAWSAPSDETFVHFDFARAWARGHPFAWNDTSGFSSGESSALYPAVLALGYLAGLRGPDADGHPDLMIAAVAIAVVSMLVFFSSAARLVAPHGPLGKYFLPLCVLSAGGLGFALWSGLEHALTLGVWGAAMASAHGARSARHRLWPAWRTGLWCALLAACSPQGACCIPIIAGYAVLAAPAPRAARLAGLLVPALVWLGVGAFANRMLTGEWLPSHLIARLGLFDPYRGAGDLFGDFLARLGALGRALAQELGGGATSLVFVALALSPLAVRRTRALASTILLQIAVWLSLTALDSGSLERAKLGAAPALAWLLVLDALALAHLVRKRAGPGRRVRVGLAAAAVLLLIARQAPHFTSEVTRFAQASRKLLDRGLGVGERLRGRKLKRVLVDEPGAMTWASDRPSIDLAGLGGFGALPFARARRHGIAAVLELIERLEPNERPDLLALRPDAWGELPIYFGRWLFTLEAPGDEGARGPALYEASWRAFDRSGRPRDLRHDERVLDELDFGDLVSERAHDYQLPAPGGTLRYRLLGDPSAPERDLFDAGRVLPEGARDALDLRMPQRGGRLLVRLAPETRGSLRVYIAGVERGSIALEPRSMLWQELAVPLEAGLPESARVELEALGAESTQYHLWALESRDGAGAHAEARIDRNAGTAPQDATP